MEDKKELIWVSDTLKKQIDDMESDKGKLDLVNRFIQQKQMDITSDIECLNDDLLRFKSFALRYKTEFEKACDEQTQKIEDVFNNCNTAQSNVYNKINTVKNGLQSTMEEINKVNKSLDSISTYKIEKLIEVLEKFNKMSNEDKKLLEILMINSNNQGGK